VIRQVLRAQQGEDPHDGVRVQRHADPSVLRRQPAAASTSCGAAAAQAVTSCSDVHPHSAAAVHIARTDASECRIPRGSRGSGTAVKQSSRFPPAAAYRLSE
jgi:hypothetical protein